MPIIHALGHLPDNIQQVGKGLRPITDISSGIRSYYVFNFEGEKGIQFGKLEPRIVKTWMFLSVDGDCLVFALLGVDFEPDRGEVGIAGEDERGTGQDCCFKWGGVNWR